MAATINNLNLSSIVYAQQESSSTENDNTEVQNSTENKSEATDESSAQESRESSTPEETSEQINQEGSNVQVDSFQSQEASTISYEIQLEGETKLERKQLEFPLDGWENVKLEIDFGKALGAYTFDIAYDNNIFEYVNVDGGTANDTSDKVRVTYYDSTGGTNPRNNMIIEFKAKDGITTSNPTEFTITAEGLANADASESYDDITSPIVKNVTVEPEYVDYTINLETSGDIIVGEENEMTLSYSSPMGHYYEHARLIGEAISPNGATVKLLGTDEANLEHDIIESGWGDAQGYKIGGKDVSQVLTHEIGEQYYLIYIAQDNAKNISSLNILKIEVVGEEINSNDVDINLFNKIKSMVEAETGNKRDCLFSSDLVMLNKRVIDFTNCNISSVKGINLLDFTGIEGSLSL